MIHEIQPYSLNNQYVDKKPQRLDRIMIFNRGQVFVCGKDQKEAIYPIYQEVCFVCGQYGFSLPEFTYLFEIAGENFFLMQVDSDIREQMIELIEGEFIRLHDLRRRTPKSMVLAGSTAWHLFCWYSANQYCGACGEKMHHDTKERMMKCDCCGNMAYPMIAPAVIVAVTDGDRILLTKYAHNEYTRYALVAGFTEIGECAEETVAREVLEETGVKVKNIKYYKSQPWGFGRNLLLGYYCELDGDDNISMDDGELSIAEWVHYNDVPLYDEGLSLTEEMMNKFVESRKNLALGRKIN